MAIQSIQFGIPSTPTATFPFRYLSISSFNNLSGDVDIDVRAVIISEFAANFFPTAFDYAYMVTWVVSSQYVSGDLSTLKNFSGFPPRRNFGIYAVGRGNAIVRNELLVYETQTSIKSCFCFSNFRDNINGGVVSVPTTAEIANQYFGAGTTGSLAQSQISAQGLLGATRYRVKITPGFVFNFQVQAQIDYCQINTGSSINLIGDVL